MKNFKLNSFYEHWVACERACLYNSRKKRTKISATSLHYKTFYLLLHRKKVFWIFFFHSLSVTKKCRKLSPAEHVCGKIKFTWYDYCIRSLYLLPENFLKSHHLLCDIIKLIQHAWNCEFSSTSEAIFTDKKSLPLNYLLKFTKNILVGNFVKKFLWMQNLK